MGGVSSTTDDGWDWPMMIVLAYRYLGWNEKTFWSESPRRFWSLIHAALEHESAKWGGSTKKSKNMNIPTSGSIDKIPGWD